MVNSEEAIRSKHKIMCLSVHIHVCALVCTGVCMHTLFNLHKFIIM